MILQADVGAKITDADGNENEEGARARVLRVSSV